MFIPILFVAAMFFAHPTLCAERKPLRILMLVQQYPLYLETFVINEIKGLCDAGHEVHILAQYPICRDERHELESYHLDQRTYYRELPKEIRSFDIVYAQFSHLAPFALEQKKKCVGAKLVVNFRGGDKMLNADSAEDKKAHELFSRTIDCAIAVCESIKKRLLDLGYVADKVCVIPTGIQGTKFAFKSRVSSRNETVHIMSVGRLVEQKGFEFALRAIAQVYRKHKNIRYTIAGSGALQGYLGQLAKQLSIAHVATLVGQKNHQEIAQLLEASHIYVLPSVTARDGRCEGIPDSLKEAMMCGLPVVSTIHSGIPELVEEGKSGFLVKERDVNALADRINYLIENPHLWPAMGKEGHAMIERSHAYQLTIAQLESLFNRLAQG